MNTEAANGIFIALYFVFLGSIYLGLWHSNPPCAPSGKDNRTDFEKRAHDYLEGRLP
jgi:hypothetical protein